jgi:hypothetical protein
MTTPSLITHLDTRKFWVFITLMQYMLVECPTISHNGWSSCGFGGTAPWTPFTQDGMAENLTAFNLHRWLMMMRLVLLTPPMCSEAVTLYLHLRQADFTLTE